MTLRAEDNDIDEFANRDFTGNSRFFLLSRDDFYHTVQIRDEFRVRWYARVLFSKKCTGKPYKDRQKIKVKRRCTLGNAPSFYRLMNSIKFNHSINYYCKNNIKDKSSIFKKV